MTEAYEYGEDEFEEDDFDENDEIRMQILEAETNEVWLEEPGDEDDEAEPPMNPLFSLFSAAGGMDIPVIPPQDPGKETQNHEDPEN